MMGFFEDRSKFVRGYADKLPLEFMKDLEGLRDAFISDCIVEMDDVALRRKQGAAEVLKQICDVLRKGVDAPSTEDGISSVY